MPLLFAVTLFLSASLLFMVQPMVGKMILPLLGGSPAVWNACMVFFQALLLVGYLYAHHLSSRFGPKKQWLIHMGVLFVPVAVMLVAVVVGGKHTPIAVAEGLAPSGDASPFLSAMALLAVAIGVPFFVSSTSAPLLQKWFAYTGHPSARDPYFLYAASNAGSLISLLGYPLLIEPNLAVAGQTWVWAVGFGALILFIAACGRAAANPIGVPPASAKLAGAKPATGALTASPEPPPSPARVLKWVALAFVPSSLMLGVTFHMSTDIASIPLLWVIPLALYLVTFIIAFGRVPAWFRLVIGNLAPVMILLLVFLMVASSYVNPGTGITLFLHIATFFAAALMCHYELAADRPKDVTHLTNYFLWMSVGGVLGGLFNALFAPLVFPLAYEYPITLVVACLMVPDLIRGGDGPADQPAALTAYKRKVARVLDLGAPVALGIAFWLLVSFVHGRPWFAQMVRWATVHLTLRDDTVVAVLLYAVPVMACFFFVDRPARFALCVAVLLGVHHYRSEDSDIAHTERSFFGILKVEKHGALTRLVHGTTLHGSQINDSFRLHWLDEAQAIPMFTPWDTLATAGPLVAFRPGEEPLTYYHRTGPVGAMFHELRTRKNGADARAHVAMVGLGTGSVSCYALGPPRPWEPGYVPGAPGQKLTFYEIDPAVKRLVAETDRYFTYVSSAEKRGAKIDFRMGDARLKLREDVDRKYALLLVDAFSSDAIPVHLLTKEAVELYMDRLTEDGILALHISNKFVRLEPVVARIADELKLTARVWNDHNEGGLTGKTASSWVVLAKDEQTLGVLAKPATTQVLAFGTRNPALITLLKKYGPDVSAREAMIREYGDDFGRTKVGGEKPKDVGLAPDDFAKKHGPQTKELVSLIRQFDDEKESMTLGRLTISLFGPMFHPLTVIPSVRLWTDDYSDVLQVMMIKEVQWMRKIFGLSTPGVEE
ncbi:MAG: hypothetical protein JWO38_1922 [Gemmataceae bacterium]|nr:hypothetical protein [Gemmataceae bacterium]